MRAIMVGDIVRVLAADPNNGRVGIVVAPARGAEQLPQGWVWVEFASEHPKRPPCRLADDAVDLIAPKSLNP